MFDGVAPDRPLKLRPLLDAALAAGRLSAERWPGRWIDVGTPERLRQAQEEPLA
jgi:MurNAc alpha-1-phosphate uridylyltransferase